MRKYVVLLLWVLDVLVCEAVPTGLNSTDANIYGHVVDKYTHEHLPFMTVALKGTTIGAATDATGHYFLRNLPEGWFIVVVTAVGYKTQEREVVLKKGQTLELNFEVEEDQVALDEVVVSANRNETTRRQAPAIVKVLDTKLFEATGASCLAEGLSFQPGVRVENNCQNCGFQQVRINGLDGPYTQILIDSRPVFSALSGVYGLEQIPANMIERVEVVRGGGSALFGSSAIAGTINVITKEPQRNSAQVAHMTDMIGGKSVFDNATSLNASLVSDNHKGGVYVFAQSRSRSEYDHDGDGYSELPKLKSKTAGMRSFLKTGTYSRLTVEYHTIHEFRRGGNLMDRPPHEADIAEQVEHDINTGGVKFDYFSPNERSRFSLFSSMQHIDRESYYGVKQDPNAYGNTADLTYVGGGQFFYHFNRLAFMPSDLTLGAEFNYDELADRIKGYERDFTQRTRIYSVFFQNEWKNETWSVLLGGRLDKHNMLGHVVFSPRVNLRFNPTADLNFRASYSGGFRAPQAFDEDLHIAAVGGDVAIIRLAPGLKEEKSRSVSVSADWYHRFGQVRVNFLAEGFYTNLKDVFVLEDISKEDGIITKERRNGSGAEVMGVNLEARAVFTRWFELQAGATLQRSRYKEPEVWSENPDVPAEKRLFRTPDVYGYFTALLNPAKRFSASMAGTYTGRMLVQHMAGVIAEDRTEKTPDFFDMELKLGYDVPLYKEVTLQWNVGVRNIFDAYQKDFDQGADRDSGYMYGPGIPRSYYAGLKIMF
ncbi:MAG: TonB-dependent receptor [Oscillibacter sp.]|nr:TonB-dependent receptor [Oscillibacter sp.]